MQQPELVMEFLTVLGAPLIIDEPPLGPPSIVDLASPNLFRT